MRLIRAEEVAMLRMISWPSQPAEVALLLWSLALLFTAPSRAAAAEGVTAPAPGPAPVLDPEKSWKFDDHDNLVFFSPCPNADGSRFIRWKDYNWTVLGDSIVVSDPREYGTTLQGRRGQLDKDSKVLSDKDLMNELKKEAGDVRSSREPDYGTPYYYGMDYGGWWGFPHRHFFGHGFRGGHFGGHGHR
jgi:hypothetical protein